MARVTGLPESTVEQLVTDATDPRPLGFLGDPGVNVTRLNLALRARECVAVLEHGCALTGEE